MMRKIIGGLLVLLVAPVYADPFNMDTYTQKFEIVFDSPEAASRARLEALPLYHGYDQAFSNRWDDNHMDSLKVREVMEKYKQKGTFFLNDSQGYTAPSEAGITLTDGTKLAPALLQGGNSIGAHSLNHEFVPYLNRNRQFFEVMGCRVDREVNSQSPVLTYAFSFMSIKNDLEPAASQKDFAEILKRSGFYHLSEHPFADHFKNDFLIGYLICGDGGEPGFGLDFGTELAKKRADADKPLWVVSMHPWVEPWGGKEFSKLQDVYKKWSGKKDWWYCNQNEYAAYRYQFLYSGIKTKVVGKALQVTVTRPDPLDLGDMTPLSFAVKGARPAALRGTGVKPAEFKGDSHDFTFDLPHNADHGTPEAYGPEALGFDADLTCAGNILKLDMKNPSGKKVENVRVTFRLPLKWKEGVIKRTVKILDKKGSDINVSLEEPNSDYLYTSDRAYVVAQIDAVSDGKRVRGYATCFEDAPKSDASYPHDGFLVLGPFCEGPEKTDTNYFAERVLTASVPDKSYSFGKQKFSWKVPSPGIPAELSPEIITAGGRNNSRTFYKWDKAFYVPGPDPLYYIVWGKVKSSKAGIYEAVFDKPSVLSIELNGATVKGTKLSLKKGMNDLRILYSASAGPHSSFSPNHYGVWFRLVDGKGQRVEDIKYIRPEVK